jgi:hypothetical protein
MHVFWRIKYVLCIKLWIRIDRTGLYHQYIYTINIFVWVGAGGGLGVGMRRILNHLNIPIISGVESNWRRDSEAILIIFTIIHQRDVAQARYWIRLPTPPTPPPSPLTMRSIQRRTNPHPGLWFFNNECFTTVLLLCFYFDYCFTTDHQYGCEVVILEEGCLSEDVLQLAERCPTHAAHHSKKKIYIYTFVDLNSAYPALSGGSRRWEQSVLPS